MQQNDSNDHGAPTSIPQAYLVGAIGTFIVMIAIAGLLLLPSKKPTKEQVVKMAEYSNKIEMIGSRLASQIETIERQLPPEQRRMMLQKMRQNVPSDASEAVKSKIAAGEGLASLLQVGIAEERARCLGLKDFETCEQRYFTVSYNYAAMKLCQSGPNAECLSFVRSCFIDKTAPNGLSFKKVNVTDSCTKLTEPHIAF